MIRSLALALLASTALVPFAAGAQTLPTGGTVAAGTAAIGQAQNNGLTIDQTSQRAVIDWQSFSVGAGGHVDIVQPNAAAALLNRVTGSATSTIAGQINANGQVFLVNPNGIVITKTGSVNAAGFVASTLDITNADFMAGRYAFAGKGGSIANAGTIAIVRGGYAALLGGKVDNSGYIVAPLGRIGLGAAARATLDLAGDGFLQVTLPTASDGGVAMSGRISADGGTVLLATADARDAARHTVNLTGVIEARGLEGRSGSVTLTGGDVTLTGATVDVSGAGGGGTIRIGGDRQGGGTLAHADTVSIDASSRLLADAVGSGAGGQVTVWSDTATSFAGAISARGAGGGDGDGGDAEVSSKGVLAYTGTADLRGAGFGTLLLDPYNITISTGADANHDGSFTATGNDSVVNATTLQNALGTANVTVSTGAAGSAGTQAGNITVSAPLTWATNAVLTLQAAGSIALNSSIAAAAGGLTLNAGGSIATGAAGTVSVAAFTLAGGAWSQVGTLPAFAAGDFRLTGGSFVRATGGNGSAGNPYLLTDAYGLQGVATLPGSNYRLVNDIDGSGTATWNGGLGFTPIGHTGGYFTGYFTGTFNGDGHVVTGLTINQASTTRVGLFAVNDGTVQALGLSGGSITGNLYVGGLIGQNRGTATQLFSNAAITGTNAVGGIVGYNEGQVTNSYAFGRVSGTAYAGGLVGQNVNDLGAGSGTIATSWSSAVVNGSGGGLVGNNVGTVTNSYWDTQTSGMSTSAGGTPLTTAQARDASNYTGFDFTNTWFQSGDLRPILVSQGGAGTTHNVANLIQLQLVAAKPGDTFTQTADIDASATSNGPATGIFGPSGFVPIGSTNTNFTGSYTGQSFHIANLYVNSTAGGQAAGLFGYVGTGGTVNGVALTGVSVTGNSQTGGVVGFLQGGTVTGSSVAGTVVGPGPVGGLVGFANNAIISASTSSVSVVGGIALIGGLVGTADATAISTSSATGSVRGPGQVGGLVGYLGTGSTVTDSYSTASVLGQSTTPVGGLIGESAGSVTRAYASGPVQGLGGGLVGTQDASGTLNGNYWDTGTTGQSAAVYTNNNAAGTANNTALTTAQARMQSSYGNLNFASTWYQTGDSRPFLRSEGHAATAGGTTNVDSLAGLELMSANLAGNYVLTENIDASASVGGTSGAGVFSTGGFVPVGFSSGNAFTGTFDGQGHTIAGLTINRTSPANQYAGLFGYAQGATLQNVSFTGGSVAGSAYVGGLVGEAVNTTIAYVTNSGSVSGTLDHVGGIVGTLSYMNPGTAIIHDSSATGSVTGRNMVGGLVGDNEGGTVQWTYATGAVNGTDYVGGLVGYNSNGTILTSYALGAVTSPDIYVGGLVGDSVQNSTIFEAYAQGNVTGKDFVGGFAGNVDGGGSVIQAYSANKVAAAQGSTHVGAFAGANGISSGQITTLTYTYYDSTLAPITAIGTAGAGSATPTGLPTPTAQDYKNYTTNYAGFSFPSVDPVNGVWVPPNQAGQDGIATAHYPEFGRLSKAVVVQPVTATRVYGNLNPTLIAVYSFVQPGDFVTSPGTVSSGATVTSAVGTYPITVSNVTVAAATPPAYRIVTLPGVLTVTVRPVTVTGGLINVAYGGAIPTTTTNLSVPVGTNTSGTGLVNGDTIGSAAVTNPTASSTSNVGTYAYTPANAVFTAGSASNYAITYVNGPLQIVPASLTITPDGQTRVYGDANPASGTATANGLVNGDMISTVSLSTPATTASPVGTYALTGSNAVFIQGMASNYAISYLTAPNGLTVTVRPITVAADAISRVYGNVNPALTYTVGGRGLVNGDTLSGALATSAGVTSDVGNYAITQGTLTASTNYALTFTGNTLAVTPRPVTITGGTLARAYGDANPTTTTLVNAPQGTATSGSGLVNGDTIGSIAVTNPTATQTSNVGTYAYTPANAVFTTGKASNYTVSYANGVLQVTPRALTVTPDAQSRVYGDANPASGTATADNLVNGDTIASVSLTSPATMQSNVGIYDLTGANAMFGMGMASNYAITYATRTGGLSVTPRPITVTADGQSRIYGNANPPLTYAVGGRGLVNGDTLSGALATPATQASPVGNYAITQGSLAATSNYTLTYVGNTLVITPRALVVTPDATSRVYGDANPASGTASGDNLVNGDTITSVALSSPATVQSNIGNYDLSASNAMGTGLSNYTISYATRPGGLTVTPRPITVTADNKARQYGDANPPLTYTVGGRGLVNGDMLSGMLTTPATPQSNVGVYAINQGSVAASASYALSFTPGTLTVGQRALSIAPTPTTRTYGDPTPTTGPGVPTGLVNGDTVTTVTLTTPATVASPVGTYALTPGNAQGTGLTNYVITYVTLPNGLTIAQRQITIAANPATRYYGDANPAFTYTVGGRGLANGDTLAGSLATGATMTSGIGNYAIALGTLGSGNYAITGFTGNTLSVTPRPLLVTADNQYRVVGAPVGPLTYTVGPLGLVNGDVLSGMLATSATSSSAVGLYPIAQGSIAASANYALTFAPGMLVLTGVAPAQMATLASNQLRDTVEASYADRGIANLIVTPTATGTIDFDSVEPVLAPTCPRGAPCPDDVKTSGTGTRPYRR